MLREKFKWRPHKNESTNARHWGGLIRSSEETSVMEGGAKGLGCPVVIKCQPSNWEESFGYNKIILDIQTSSLGCVQEGKG